MNTSFLEKIAVGTSALLFSVSAFSFTPRPAPDPVPEPPVPCEGECDFTRGADPTSSYLEASSGPYSVRTENVARSVSGFGGGTIHYPTNTSGTMGAIAIVPGFFAAESSIAWWGPRLASHGFVVITIATNSTLDQPGSRATQLNSALDHVISQSNSSSSAISGMVDSSRVGVMGWSMGGGGALRVASGNRLSAVIPLAPWNTGGNDFDEIDTPTLIKFIAMSSPFKDSEKQMLLETYNLYDLSNKILTLFDYYEKNTPKHIFVINPLKPPYVNIFKNCNTIRLRYFEENYERITNRYFNSWWWPYRFIGSICAVGIKKRNYNNR
jgi:dienelactone hydrolase